MTPQKPHRHYQVPDRFDAFTITPLSDGTTWIVMFDPTPDLRVTLHATRETLTGLTDAIGRALNTCAECWGPLAASDE